PQRERRRRGKSKNIHHRGHREHREDKDWKKRRAEAFDRKSPPFAQNAKDGAPSSSGVGWPQNPNPRPRHTLRAWGTRASVPRFLHYAARRARMQREEKVGPLRSE